MAVEEFVQKTIDLLEREREAEIHETQILSERLSSKELEKRGVCLRKLQLRSHRSGLYGRMVVVFHPENHGGKNTKVELPSNNISPGDIIGVGLTNSIPTEKPLATGIVLHVSGQSITVAFDESQDVMSLDDSASYKLTKLANDVTYRRLKTNLNNLLKYRDGPSRRLIDTLFCLEEISIPAGEFPFSFVNTGLDTSQREAVKFALIQRELAIIHGPPGTGKTTTVVEIILQSVAQGLKVLVTAPSNIAVDNLLERLVSSRPAPRLVRLGHPARLMPHLTKYSLDAVVSAAEETDIVHDVKNDLQKTLAKLKKTRGTGERRALRDEMKHLRDEVRKREEKATTEILSRAQIVLSTLTSATGDGPLKHLKDGVFDLVVIDECSQALEAACWIGLLQAKRCVLAGDHLQLPPTILSKEAATGGLELTLMERLLASLADEKGRDVMRMLTTQYRMHQDIMTWSSQELYQGKLTAHSSVATHLLKDLDGVTDCDETRAALLLIDTAGCDLLELDLPEEVSKGNEGEADVVAAHVESLVKAGIKPVDIAVIAPYNMQVDLLRARLCQNHSDLEVKSVDGFQGREKEAVVISMVRSNTKGEVGFLSERRRINVAITRARRHLAVICDSETVCHDPFISSLVNYMMENGDVLSAHQIIDGVSVNRKPFHFPDDKVVKKKVQEGQQTKARPSKPVMVSKEEKAEQFRQQLDKFVADVNTSTLDFPPELNSHDRMVVHEVAEQMGLGHMSLGEGKERHIRVFKPASNSTDSVTLGEATLPTLPSDREILIDSPSQEKGCSTGTDDSQNENVKPDTTVEECTGNLQNGVSEKSTKPDLNNASSIADKTHANQQELCCTEIQKKVLTLSEGQEEMPQKASVSSSSMGSQETNQSNLNSDACPHCKKNVPSSNRVLHELHCSKQNRQPSSNLLLEDQKQRKGEGGARKKENRLKSEQNTKEKKEKAKPKISHVQKASDVLSKVPDDDFDALISTITALDGKCAFKKCKTLTTTLGRNCTLCDRRFCLSHLTPEVHGCGDAAKEQARRNLRREGAMHPGSGVPDKRPNEARRAQLEIRMDKKKEEFSKARARKTEKKKS